MAPEMPWLFQASALEVVLYRKLAEECEAMD